MDYLEFYGLEQEPFSSAPISRFYFNSAQHQRALVRLMYAVDTMKGLTVLIGELGTGKTTLARRMLDNLPEEEYESALLVIIHSGITADWLLSRIARQLGVEDPAPEKLKLLNQLYSRLVDLHEEGKKAVVLIDEAQMLHTKELMEEFRGLLNLELPESKLITFVFFGLPELEDYLHLDEPLAQRVALKCTLDSFTFESTQGYINHRLRLAGAKVQLFPDDTIKLIHHYSRGIPRLINTICDNSLFEGYLLKKRAIEPELVQAVSTDLGLAPIPTGRRRTSVGAPARVIPVSGQQHQPAAAPPSAEDQPIPRDLTPASAMARESAPPTQVPDLEVPPMPQEDDALQEDEILQVEHVPDIPDAPPPLEQPAPAKNEDDLNGLLSGLTGEDKSPPRETKKKNQQGEEDIDSMFDSLEEK